MTNIYHPFNIDAIIIFDEKITQKNCDLVCQFLRKSGNIVLLEPIRLNEFLSIENNILKYVCYNRLLVIVCHGCLHISEIENKPVYFGEDNALMNEKILFLRDVAKYVWIASCSTGNIDTSCVNLTYNPNPYVSLKTIHPFIIDGSAEDERFVPVITIRWLLAFLNVMGYFAAQHGFQWWTCDAGNHPLRVLSSYNLKEESKLRKKIAQIAERLTDADSDVLFPNTLSFPELFHCGVFVSFFPDSRLKLLCDEDAVDAYRAARKKKYNNKKGDQAERFKYMSKSLAEHCNQWLDCIREHIGNPAVSGAVSDRAAAAFQAGLNHERMKYFSNLMAQLPHSRLSPVDLLTQRLLCNNNILSNTDVSSKIGIALTIRSSSRDDQPPLRISCQDNAFLEFVKDAFTCAKTNSMRVVLMDGDKVKTTILNDVISTIVAHDSYWNDNFTDARNHHIYTSCENVFSDWVDKLTGNEFIDQLSFIHRCIVEFNIRVAFGVHSGFIDILNAFGVAPAATIRFFGIPVGDEWNHDQLEDIKNWKTRTDDQYLRFLYSTDETKWIDMGLPTLDNMNDLCMSLATLDESKST